MKKFIISLLILMFAVSMVFVGVGCKTAATETTAAETTAAETTAAETTAAETTAAISADLTLYGYWPGGTAADGLDAINKDFMAEYPGITIEVVTETGGMEYLTALATKMASGEKPDLFMTWPQFGRLDPWIKQDLIIPLDELLAEPDVDWANRAPSAFKMSTMPDGHQWTLVFDSYDQVMFYNTKVFADAGVQAPNTFDEFIDILGKIQKLEGVIPVLIAGKDQWPSKIIFSQLMLSSLSYDELIPYYEAKKSWGDDKARAALTQIERVLPYIDKENSGIGYADASLFLSNGDGAMFMMGTWLDASLVGELKMKPVTDYNAFIPPTVSPEIKKSITMDANSICIVKGTGKEEAAKIYLKYFTRQDVQEKLANLINSGAAVEEGINYKSQFFLQTQEMLKGIEKNGLPPVHTSVEADAYALQTSFLMRSISTEDFIVKMDELSKKSAAAFAQ